MMKSLLSVAAATIWSIVLEFLRNELWFKHLWTEHYARLGLAFPSAPANNVVWALWSLGLVLGLRALLTRFPTGPAALLGWFMAFPMMWLVTGNLSVLPLELLPYAIPLSVLEAWGAAWILSKAVGVSR